MTSALGLLQAPPTQHGIKEGTVDRVVLLRPKLSAASVNARLTTAWQSPQAPPAVDVYYESDGAMQRRVPGRMCTAAGPWTPPGRPLHSPAPGCAEPAPLWRRSSPARVRAARAGQTARRRRPRHVG